jgi:prepilin-type processing-associated H-X9-DG protein
MLPFQGGVFIGSHPPRCGGLACVAPKGAGGKTCYPTGHQNSDANVCFADFFTYG